MSQVSNGLASRVLDYQSRGPRFKSAFHSFKVDYMSTRNQFYQEDLNAKKKKKKKSGGVIDLKKDTQLFIRSPTSLVFLNLGIVAKFCV